MRHGSFFARSHRTRRTLRATVRYRVRLEHLLMIQNVFLLAAFYTGSPLTLLALRLARLRWPLGVCAGRGSGPPALRSDCHPGTAARHSRGIRDRSALRSFPGSMVRGRCAWRASRPKCGGHRGRRAFSPRRRVCICVRESSEFRRAWSINRFDHILRARRFQNHFRPR